MIPRLVSGVLRRLQTSQSIRPRFPVAFKSFATATGGGDSAFKQAMGNTDSPTPEQEKEEDKEAESKKAGGSGIGWAIGAGVLASYIYLDIEGENVFVAHNRRSLEAVMESYEYFMNPPTKKLLPPLPPQLHRDHTLCIELTDSLTHLVWDKEIGWRVAIRPGAKKLLYILHQYFEMVVFTNTPSHLATPVVEALDNFGLFHYRLYREHHRLDKDLSFLNRDLSKVVVVDTKQESLGTHPENGLIIKAWHGEKGDTEMEKFATFLQELVVFASTQKIDDLRPLLTAIKAHDPVDMPKAWQLHKEQMRNAVKLSLPEEKKTDEINTWSSSLTQIARSLVGSGGLVGSQQKLGANTTIDRIEQYCADTRVLLEKELASHMLNVEAHRKEQDEQMKSQIEAMKKSDLKLIDYVMGNIPPPESLEVVSKP